MSDRQTLLTEIFAEPYYGDGNLRADVLKQQADTEAEPSEDEDE